MINKELNFVLASDENYADKLAVTMYSILENHLDLKMVNIHVLSNKISSDSETKIKKVASNFQNSNVIIHNLNNLKDLIGKDVNVDHLSLAAYARLFIPKLLSLEVAKAIYLDVDVLVNNSMLEVFEIDLKGNYIGAVKSLIDLATIEEQKNGLFHINSGMLIWNLRLCREDDFVSQCLEYINNATGKIRFHDQTVINEVCKGKIKAIHPKFNVMSNMLFLKYKGFTSVYGLNNFYSEEEYNEAKYNPTVIHLTSWVVGRPWETGCVHPYRDKYHEILSLTPWRNNELLKSTEKYTNLIKRVLYKLVPGTIIRYVTLLKRRIKGFWG